MEKNWVKIFSSDKIHEVRLVKAILEENDIEAVEMDRPDSLYNVFSDYELYVQSHEVLRAKYLIDKTNLE